ANLEGDPKVFALPAALVDGLGAELHDRTVLKFPAAKAERVVFRWPTRTLALTRNQGLGNRVAWRAEPGYDPTGFDVSRVDAIVKALSELKTLRFLQYRGPLPSDSGLTPPRLAVQVWTSGATAPNLLRVGSALSENQVAATTATGAEGPLFVLPTGPAWDELIKPPPRAGDLPDDV